MTRRISLVAVCCSSASVRSRLRASSSVNRRTFSIAMTAWSAKVFSSSIWRSREGPRLCSRRTTMVPIGMPLAEHRHAEDAATASAPAQCSGDVVLGRSARRRCGRPLRAENALDRSPCSWTLDASGTYAPQRHRCASGRVVHGYAAARWSIVAVEHDDGAESPSQSRAAFSRWCRTPAGRRSASWR